MRCLTWILPHLKDRPLSLKRYPNGIKEDFFFQKNVHEVVAPWLRTEWIDSEHNGAPDPLRVRARTAPACCTWRTWAASIRTRG